MKRITLAMLVFTVGAPGLGAAQEPPPVRPVAPMAPLAPSRAAIQDAQRDLRDALETSRRQGLEDARLQMREALDASRAQIAASRVDTRESLEETRQALEQARLSMDVAGTWDGFAPMAPMPPMAPMAPMAAIAPMADFGPMPTVTRRGWASDAFPIHMPPEPWAQGDPADSVYRVARDAINRGDYGRAARLFADIAKQFPKSVYANDAPYWEALALYKIGTTDELRVAAKVLEPLVTQASTTTTSYGPRGRVLVAGQPGEFYRRSASEGEVVALYQRINGALAQRGDQDAAKKVEAVAKQAGTSPCDQEDIQVRTEALNALAQMDPTAALPALRRVLDRKDECSALLRRNAVFILGRRADSSATPLLIAVAKSDPDIGVRTQAIDFLSRLPGDAGLSELQDLLKTDQDERVQRAAVRALMQSDNAQARSSVRALIERKDAPLGVRVEVISSLASDRATTDDASYLRSLYGRADNDRIKEAIISALSRMGGPENDQFVLGIARNQNEPSQLRSVALSRFARSSTVSIADLGKLYDSADNYNMRSQIINLLANRREPEATDKLIDIIRNGTDYRIRSQAINAITRKNDPRATKLLMDIIDKSPADSGKKP